MSRPRNGLSAALGDFPWDTIAEAAARARSHPDGIVDLSVGTPVDPTPELGRRALAEAADSPGYPTTIGTAELRSAMVSYLSRRWGATGLVEAQVQPVLGTKEAVAWLPTQLGLGPGDTVMFPSTAYPTYEVGARLARCAAVADDGADAIRRHRPALVWINSPSNPTGATLPPGDLRDVVAAARGAGAIVASDECYGEFGWEVDPVSVLHPDVCGGDHTGLLVLHSLSKRSNLAGYRAGFVAGDAALVSELTQVRKHGGMLMPGPVQHAMAVLLADTAHVVEQRERYRRRRAVLRPALEAYGLRVDRSEAGLYLWSSGDEDARITVDRLADLGILAAPGDFYGEAGTRHVRVALTATDERIAAAAERLTAS